MAYSFMDRVSNYFRYNTDRRVYLAILLSVSSYFIWLFSFPLFGPVLSHYFSAVKALAIERGRFVQFFMLSMVASSVMFGYLTDHLKRRLALVWISILATSLITVFFSYAVSAVDTFVLPVILGVVAGTSLPALGAFFADNTSPDDRGRITGLSIGLSMPCSFAYILNRSLLNLPWSSELLVVSLVLLVSLVTFFLKPIDAPKESAPKKKEKGPRGVQVFCYLIPVFLFYWVGGILFSSVFPTILENVDNSVFYLTWSVPFLLGAIVAGSWFDSVGRKIPVILGLAVTGVSLAVFGVFGLESSGFLLVTLAIGFSMTMVFTFVVWADLAPTQSRGTYYGVGMGAILSAMILGLISTGTTFGSISISLLKNYMLYSSVALFICIPPLIFAEELLPRELIEKKKIHEYIEQAKRKYMKGG